MNLSSIKEIIRIFAQFINYRRYGEHYQKALSWQDRAIRNPVFLDNLIRFLADNTGKIISANSILLAVSVENIHLPQNFWEELA